MLSGHCSGKTNQEIRQGPGRRGNEAVRRYPLHPRAELRNRYQRIVKAPWFSQRPFEGDMLIDRNGSAVTNISFRVGLGKLGMRKSVRGSKASINSYLREINRASVERIPGPWMRPTRGRIYPHVQPHVLAVIRKDPDRNKAEWYCAKITWSSRSHDKRFPTAG